MSRANLLSLFHHFPEIGRDTAVVQTHGYRRQTLTYAQLHANAISLSQVLASRNIAPADRVLLWGPNSAQWLVGFWAILLCGAVAVPMDAGASPEFIARVVRDSQVKLVLRDPTQPDLSLPAPSLIYDDLATVLASAPAPFGFPGDRAARTDIAEILFTSGTTSEPRGVVLTHGNFLANLEPLEQGIDEYRKKERWFHPLRFVSVVPLSHIFGQIMGVFVPSFLAATIVFENSALPSEILRSIKRERATVLIVVPRMLDAVRAAFDRDIDSRGWRTWFNSAYAAAKDEWFWFRPWRFRRLHSLLGWKFWAFISGGAALSSETEEYFKRIGYAVVQGYGMTETASLISLNHPFAAIEGSVGKILPGREFRLAPDGEILVRGENVSAGYWEKGALRPAGQENDGWLHTGDLGELDADGNLRFRGRKKNVIVTPAGLNIYPEDLEAALRKQPTIRDAVVIPLQISGNAEPCAVLLLKNSVIPSAARNPSSSSDHSARSAIEAANSSLADYQRIRRWLPWPEPDFPRTPTGKPRLAVIASCAAQLLSSHALATSAQATSNKTLAIPSGAKDLLSSSTCLGSIPQDLKDLSSLDRVEFLSSLEHQYNVELNETQFANAKSAADIQQLLAQPSARRTDFVFPLWTQRQPVQFIRSVLYYLLNWPFVFVMGHPRVRGRENLANVKAPVLFVSNHVTRKADLNLILCALPVRFRHHLAAAMGGENLRNFRHPPREWFFAKRWLWQIGYFLLVALFNVFPLPQHSGFRQSFRFAGESADRGYSLLVFPEGIINDRDTPDMAAFQQGIGVLAQNINLPIVPVRLDGLWQMLQQKRRIARIGEVTVLFGAPVSFPPDTPPAEIASRLQSIIQSL
ncbi:MAG TPA: AMP-binding protein [Candidatus Sulfotelmatobacter sp.]|nr:AMP-binding protein [Candidatus Sulfotelmatobacter sp.]